MAVLDPYAPCPCGSGEKYKWCCQKVEEFAVRAQRLIDNGQMDSALSALNEGLRKNPENPWLSIHKTILLARRREYEPAKELLRQVIQKQPAHTGAQNLLVRLTLASEDPRAAAGQFQQALGEVPSENRAGLWSSAELIGVAMAESGQPSAALAHLRLAAQLAPDELRQDAEEAYQSLESRTSISPWLRNPYRLSAVPEGIDPSKQERFQEAIGWADQGRWAAAASAFDTLSAEGTPESDRNLGLCRLWLGDDSGAIEALRRYTSWGDEITPEKVDLEALCQLISPLTEEDKVELLQWIWPVRDHDRLLAALREDDRVSDRERTLMEPENPDSFEVDLFLLLDKPLAEDADFTKPDAFPRVQGRVLVGREIVALEALDDGRLDDLAQRFQGIAGDAIKEVHPRTKVLGEASRATSQVRIEWVLPEGFTPEKLQEFEHLERQRMVLERWPETRWSSLGHRTPRQAAQDGDARLALRAAFCQLEFTQAFFRGGIDYDALRQELQIDPEPTIDPKTVEIDQVHLARLQRIPAKELDDERLLALFERTQRFTLPMALEQAAEALADRPNLLDAEKGVPRFVVYSTLANLAMGRMDREGSTSWVRRGRESDPASHAITSAAQWDFLEVRLQSSIEPPELWVPSLAAIMERYGSSEETGSIIATNLLGMGLLRLERDPNNPNETVMDSRPLMALLSEYGPKITTATGELGVSASRGGIWTPESDQGGAPSGGIWTPGASTGKGQTGPDKPGLIIPGS